MKRLSDEELTELRNKAVALINKGSTGRNIESIAVSNLIIIELFARQNEMACGGSSHD